MIPICIVENDAGRFEMLGCDNCHATRRDALYDALMASAEPLRSIGFRILRDLQTTRCISRPVRSKR